VVVFQEMGRLMHDHVVNEAHRQLPQSVVEVYCTLFAT
jgi:hypothetical protein